MCIKIVKAEKEIPYDIGRPLEDQLIGSSQVIVDYQPFDESIDSFLKEVERIVKNGISANLSIRVLHNNHIFGFKVKQKLKSATNNMVLNDIIKLMVLSQIKTDKKFEELMGTFSDMVK